MYNFYIIFLLLLFNLFIITFFKDISNFINIFDAPNTKNKIHKYPIPAIGGFIIITNFFLFLILMKLFNREAFYGFYHFGNLHTVVFLFTIISLFSLGAFDDKYQISSTNKLLLFFIIFYILCEIDGTLAIKDLRFSFYSETLNVGHFSLALSIFLFISIISAVNMMDGINGHVIIFFSAILIFLFFRNINFSIFFICISICLIFLSYLNFSNKMFLGDSGSYLLAFIFFYIFLKEYNFKRIIFIDNLLSLFFIPLLDMCRLVFKRLLDGKNPMHGDLNHIHHILNKKIGLTKTIILLFSLYNYQLHFYNLYSNKFFYFFSLIFIYLLLILYFKFAKFSRDKIT